MFIFLNLVPHAQFKRSQSFATGIIIFFGGRGELGKMNQGASGFYLIFCLVCIFRMLLKINNFAIIRILYICLVFLLVY